MNIIAENSWQPLTQTNQILIQKWEALQHARQHGNEKEILAAEMQYLCALQNVVSVVQISVSPASRKSA